MKIKSLFIFSLLILILFNLVISEGESEFNGISISKSYKEINNHNPCITTKFTSEPGVMEYNGRIYLYGTNDGSLDTSFNQADYRKINTINIMSSADLVNWSDHGTIEVVYMTSSCSGPTAVHKTVKGKEKFFLYFSVGLDIEVMTSDSPIGPWSSAVGLDLHPINMGLWIYDPAVLIDTDGSAYLYYGGGVHAKDPQTLRVIKLKEDMISYDGSPINITAPYFYSDSGINKIGNTYIYSYSTNWLECPYCKGQTAYMTSNNPLGPFTFQGICFKNPGEFFIPSLYSHHAIIYFKGKYYIFYHAQWLDKQLHGRTKGYRATHVDVMPVNGVKLGEAIGTLTGVDQIELVDPYIINTFYTFAWQAGIKVIGDPGEITCYKRGDWTGISGVNFNRGAKSITINGGCSSSKGSTIRITVDSPSGDVIGYVSFPFTSINFQISINVTSEINNVKGVKNIFFVASNDVFLNYYIFSP